MSDFLDGSEDYFENGDGQPEGDPKDPPMRAGRYVLYKFKCPLCGKKTGGKKCGVRKKTTDKFPVLYCVKYKKWVECVYEYV